MFHSETRYNDVDEGDEEHHDQYDVVEYYSRLVFVGLVDIQPSNYQEQYSHAHLKYTTPIQSVTHSILYQILYYNSNDGGYSYKNTPKFGKPYTTSKPQEITVDWSQSPSFHPPL